MNEEHVPQQPEQSLGEQLTICLDKWSAFFENATKKDALKAAPGALEELDTLWFQMGMMNENCLASGLGAWSEPISETAPEAEPSIDEGDVIDAESEGPKIVDYRVRFGEFTLENVRSLGFVFADMLGQDNMRLWQQFLIQTTESTLHPTVKHATALFAYAHPETLTCIPMHALEEPFDELDEEAYEIARYEAQADALNHYSTYMVKMLRSTGFRRHFRRREQLQEIDEVIKDAEMISGVKGADVLAEPIYAYRSKVTPEGIDYQVLGLQGACLSGICLGLTMIGREALTRKALRRDSDLPTLREGISFSLELDSIPAEAAHLDLVVGDIVHIPISSQKFDATFRPRQQIREILEAEEEANYESNLE